MHRVGQIVSLCPERNRHKRLPVHNTHLVIVLSIELSRDKKEAKNKFLEDIPRRLSMTFFSSSDMPSFRVSRQSSESNPLPKTPSNPATHLVDSL